MACYSCVSLDVMEKCEESYESSRRFIAKAVADDNNKIFSAGKQVGWFCPVNRTIYCLCGAVFSAPTVSYSSHLMSDSHRRFEFLACQTFSLQLVQEEKEEREKKEEKEREKKEKRRGKEPEEPAPGWLSSNMRDRSPSPVRCSSPVRGRCSVRRGSPSRVRSPSPARVRRPSPARVRRPSPVRGMSPVKRGSPVRVRSPSPNGSFSQSISLDMRFSSIKKIARSKSKTRRNGNGKKETTTEELLDMPLQPVREDEVEDEGVDEVEDKSFKSLAELDFELERFQTVISILNELHESSCKFRRETFSSFYGLGVPPKYSAGCTCH